MSVKCALRDVTDTFMKVDLVGLLGWHDVKVRYKRSALGPFWLTLSMSIMIATIGLVFGQMFDSTLNEFFPFLAVGIILWSFITTVIAEGSLSFIHAESIIKQSQIPLFVHVLRVIWRNVLIFCHNVVIIPFVFIVMGKNVGDYFFLSLLGFLILLVNIIWMVLLASIVSTRYRDLHQIIQSLMQVLFYLTPIMWMPSYLPKENLLLFLQFNPFYHFIEIIRSPLLGMDVNIISWVVSISFAVIGWLFTLLLYGKYKRRIAYWL